MPLFSPCVSPCHRDDQNKPEVEGAAVFSPDGLTAELKLKLKQAVDAGKAAKATRKDRTAAKRAAKAIGEVEDDEAPAKKPAKRKKNARA